MQDEAIVKHNTSPEGLTTSDEGRSGGGKKWEVLSGDDKISPMDPGRGLHLHPFTLL